MEGTCFESDWAAVAAGLSGLRALLCRLHQAGSDRLGPMFAELDELKLLAEAGQVGLLAEGLTRGDVRESDAASPAGWVRHWGHSYLAGGAAALVAVTVAIGQDRNRVLREAVLAARAPVRNAAVAIGEMDKLRPRLTPECHGTVLEGFVALAEGQGPRQIRALRPALIARYGRLGEFQRREDRLKHGVRCPNPLTMTGWPSTGCAWTRRGRPCWRPSWDRWPRRSRARSTARTCAPATSGGPTRWWRSAAAPPPPAGPPRPPPRPRWSSRWATRTWSSGPGPGRR